MYGTERIKIEKTGRILKVGNGSSIPLGLITDSTINISCKILKKEFVFDSYLNEDNSEEVNFDSIYDLRRYLKSKYL